MNSNKKFLIGCGFFPLLAILFFYIGYTMVSGGVSLSTAKYREGTWLAISPSGTILDFSELQRDGFFNNRQTSVDEICRSVRLAARDGRIAGIIIRPRFAEISYAGLNEIAAALTEFKQSGKQVIAYLDMAGQKDYLLCMQADKVYMEASASAGLLLEGVNANILFYKEMLDKLGVRFDVVQSGDVKGGGEPYTRTSLQPTTRDNIDSVLKARYDLMISDIARIRGQELAKIKAVFEERPDLFITPSQALEYGLVDELINRDAMLSNYGITKDLLVSVDNYQRMTVPSLKTENVAILNLNGTINPGGSVFSEHSISASEIQAMIDEINTDSSIKAVVLRINSPGGSALESEHIHYKLTQLRSQVPVVVSMAGVTASGGYYISTPAHKIIADPYTITGSIGVLMIIPEAEGLGRKIGLRSQNVGYGKYSGVMDFLGKRSPEVLRSLQRSADSVYIEFKSRVASDRNISMTEVETLAQGQVWSAQAALDKGLVDGIGGLKDAVAIAAELANISDYGIMILPAQKPFWHIFRNQRLLPLISSFLTAQSPEAVDIAEAYTRQRFSTNEWLYALPFEIDQ
ncbi:MAG: signal peptide peptidase SppA [Candidatus Cloacimonetes bacterium]|nr:signal peptide peptidase SppA [Candidatus Cloacimonadota bacterium]